MQCPQVGKNRDFGTPRGEFQSASHCASLRKSLNVSNMNFSFSRKSFCELSLSNCSTCRLTLVWREARPEDTFKSLIHVDQNSVQRHGELLRDQKVEQSYPDVNNLTFTNAFVSFALSFAVKAVVELSYTEDTEPEGST